jgi:maleate isomerase
VTSDRDTGDYRKQNRAIGTITPSANLVVERVTAAVLDSFPNVSAHYSRTLVRGSKDPFPDSYDLEGMLGAARLLGDAALDSIVWNGSKGANIGFAADRNLCTTITSETGIRSTTSMLAIDAELRQRSFRRVAIVTPYTLPYQEKLAAVIEREGFAVIAEAHAGVSDNLAYMDVPDADIASMIRRVAGQRPDAILTLCTNFPAAHLVERLETELDLPIYDSVLTGVYAALRLAGVDTRLGASWGRLFRVGVPS